MKKQLLISILCLVLLTSCDPAIQYEYSINNTSQKTLMVLKATHLSSTDSVVTFDDTLLVYPGIETLLLETSIIGSNPHDEKEDFLKMMFPFEIQSVDSSELKINYFERKYWTYKVDVRRVGVAKVGTNYYTLQISDEDF